MQSREGQLGEIEKAYFYKKFKTAEYQLNTFGLFSEKAIDLLKSNGVLGFIIPNYWLSTQYDRKLRKLLFQQNNVTELLNVYKVFESAVVDTVVLIAQKGTPTDARLKVKSIDRKLKTILERLEAVKLENWDFQEERGIDRSAPDINISFQNSVELSGEKTIGDYFILKFGAKLYEVGKGVPPQSKNDSKNAIYEADKEIDKSYRRLLRARHVKRYHLVWKNDWVKYGPNLAAPRDSSLFLGPRIILQRIVSGERLDACYIDTDHVCNTDVITLKPKEGTDCKFFLGILNSSLCCNYIKSRNVNLDRDAFPKINTNTLESFPVPDFSKVNPKTVSEINNNVTMLSELFTQIASETLPNAKEQVTQRINYCSIKIEELVKELYSKSLVRNLIEKGVENG